MANGPVYILNLVGVDDSSLIALIGRGNVLSPTAIRISLCVHYQWMKGRGGYVFRWSNALTVAGEGATGASFLVFVFTWRINSGIMTGSLLPLMGGPQVHIGVTGSLPLESRLVILLTVSNCMDMDQFIHLEPIHLQDLLL